MVRKLSKRLNSKRRSSVKRKKSVKRKNISMQKGGVLFNQGDRLYFIALEQDGVVPSKWATPTRDQLNSIKTYEEFHPTGKFTKEGVKPEGTKFYVRSIIKRGELGDDQLIVQIRADSGVWRQIHATVLPNIDMDNISITPATEDPVMGGV